MTMTEALDSDKVAQRNPGRRAATWRRTARCGRRTVLPIEPQFS
jgi:hypothetical protein